MKLTQEPVIVNRPSTRYIFIEKVGPFQETAPQAWQELPKLLPGISEHNKVTGFISLYKIGPKIYRAGVSVSGPYSDLPAASGRVFQIVSEKEIQQRDDFCIENYLNDPRTTPEDQLVTEILIPTVGGGWPGPIRATGVR